MRGFAGEEVWLKASQTQECRLYGCEDPGTITLSLRVSDPPSIPVNLVTRFCQPHAEQIEEGDLVVKGIVPAVKGLDG